MLGTSFPGTGQKANDNNLKMLNGRNYSIRVNNHFINPPKFKSEVTLSLLKQLSKVKQDRLIKETRLKKRVVRWVILAIFLTAILLVFI